jgi:hypothetical protein
MAPFLPESFPAFQAAGSPAAFQMSRAAYLGPLDLDPEDLRLHILAELATTAWSLSGRHWVRHGGQGGRTALLERLDGAVKAIPASLDLSAGA